MTPLDDMPFLLELLVAGLLLLGGGFLMVGSIGLARLPDIFMRLHGPTKATTLGIGAVLVAVMVQHGATRGLELQELAVSLFLFMVAPVTAHLVAKAAMRGRRDQSAAGSTQRGKTP